MITRFAPSPTGLLHIGSARAALIPYLFAKSMGGKFMLRIDDTDLVRSKQEYTDAICQDLEWLGISWDIFSRQAERIERYEEVKQQLIEAGRLYPCYETGQELDIKRKMQLGRGMPPIYDRSGLKLTAEQIKQYENEGRKPHWRFKLDESSKIAWCDIIKGDIKFEPEKLSDPILIRENGTPTYMLPSAIDDMDFGITHVVRGDDHITNTAIQVQLFEAIGGRIPQFAHHSLLKGASGKISKREGGFDVPALRAEGIEAIAINSFLAHLGTSRPVQIYKNMQELIDSFDISTFSKGAAIYDFEDLARLNSKIVHAMPYNNVRDRPAMSNVNEQFWIAVRGNLKKIDEITEWWEICNGNVPEMDDDKEFFCTARDLLPDGDWNEETWKIWTNAVKKATGRSGKSLFLPLRKALTGKDNGPELKFLLPLIGKDKVIQRLGRK